MARQKHLPAVFVSTDSSKAFGSIDCSKMEQILMVYGILEKTVKATIMMHSSIQAFASSPDGDTEYFNITDGAQKGDSRTPYLPLYFIML